MALDRVVKLLNAERENVGAPPLKVHAKLMRCARDHSRDMAENGYLGPVGPDWKSPFRRIEDVGYRWKRAGEACARGQTNAEALVRELMDSPGNRGVLLNPAYTHVGVGVVDWHWTVDLAAGDGDVDPSPEDFRI